MTKDLLAAIGIIVKRNSGSEKVLCPKCSHTRKKKNEPCLNVNIDTGVYYCHNPGCDNTGRVLKAQYEPKQKEYFKPVFHNRTELNDAIVKWFWDKRQLSQQTLIDCRITCSKQFFPQVNAERNAIDFNYLRNGELINVKYRDSDKNFRMVKNAELIFYGLDDIKDSTWCVVVEGEMDKLAFWEAGVKEVVSVPNGASKGGLNLEYLDNCIDYFQNKTKIILATDNDEPGLALREELARRLGHERCFKVNFGEYKDANDYLKAHGATLKDVLVTENLIEFPIDGIVTADMLWDELDNYLQNGLSRGYTTGVLDEFDEIVSILPGQLMALTGIPNHGKSPFALQIMCALSVKYKWKWGLFSPEHKPMALFIAKICECLLGKHLRRGNSYSNGEIEKVKSFINEHFFFIEPSDENLSVSNILQIAKDLVVRKGIRGLLIDPWNKLEHLLEKGESETNYISKQIDQIIKFDQRNDVFTIIVAHPTKIKKDLRTKLFEVPTLYDISGSSNWYNKVDLGISFYRNFKTGNNEIHVQKIKYNHLGSVGTVEVKYNINNSRFNNLNGDWDNSNWLEEKVVTEQLEMPLVHPTKEIKISFDDDDDSDPLPF